MAARIQQLIVGLNKAKQANISTVAASFMRFKKLDTDATTPRMILENDSAEIGKGHEFATQTFPSHYDVGNRIEKFATAEFATWAIAHGLGNIVQTGSGAPYTYTITPIDPGTTLELPYGSIVEQIPEGGSQALDNIYLGVAIEEFLHEINYGPGRASSKLTVNWVGSGNGTGTGYGDANSGVTVPALSSENNMLAAGMSLVVNGADYVSSGRILTARCGWKNNLLLNAGFYPGSGTKNGAQVRGRMEIGVRVPTFQFMTRLIHGSSEYNTLIAQSTGTAVLSVNHDAGNSLQYTWQKMSFGAVEQGVGDGIVAVTVTGTPMYDNTNGILTVVTKCGITGIAQ